MIQKRCALMGGPTSAEWSPKIASGKSAIVRWQQHRYMHRLFSRCRLVVLDAIPGYFLGWLVGLGQERYRCDLIYITMSSPPPPLGPLIGLLGKKHRSICIHRGPYSITTLIAFGG